MSERKPYRKFRKREPDLPIEQKVEKFVIRNSQNGFFTKVSTIPYKFDVTEDMAWSIVGELLSNGLVEATHDGYTGEMKLCENGKTYAIQDLELKRKREKYGKKQKQTRKK